MLKFQKGQEPHCSSHEPPLMLVFISCFSRRAGGYREKAPFSLLPPPHRAFWEAGWDPCGAVGAGGLKPNSGPPGRFLGEAEAASHQTCTHAPSLLGCGPCHRAPGLGRTGLSRERHGCSRDPMPLFDEGGGRRQSPPPAVFVPIFYPVCELWGVGPIWREDRFRPRHPFMTHVLAEQRLGGEWAFVAVRSGAEAFEALLLEIDRDGRLMPAPQPCLFMIPSALRETIFLMEKEGGAVVD